MISTSQFLRQSQISSLEEVAASPNVFYRVDIDPTTGERVLKIMPLPGLACDTANTIVLSEDDASSFVERMLADSGSSVSNEVQ